MQIESVTLAIFSPTGTTLRVAQAIAGGYAPKNLRCVDATSPQARDTALTTGENELLIIAVPVYMGRVPALLAEWLGALNAAGSPTVCVAVYGNRAYENALLELEDIVRERGGVPVASAAFIGEHSFSSKPTPVAHGRPDAEDLRLAKDFGQKIREKLERTTDISALSAAKTPGARPYGGVTTLWSVDFIEVGEACVRCGLCATACPVGAIETDGGSIIDHEKCITCCACIKRCPQKARTMKPGPVKDASKRLFSLFSEPKAPEIFL